MHDFTSLVSNDLYRIHDKLGEFTETFWHSKAFYPAMLFIAVIFLSFRHYVIGACVLILVSSWLLFFCKEIMAAICPFFLIFIQAAPMYEHMADFLRLVPAAIVWIFCLIFHIVADPQPIRIGNSARGLLLVSIAAIIGGSGYSSSQHLPFLLSLYYIIANGLLLFAFYVLLRSRINSVPRKQLINELSFTFITFGMAMCCCVFISYAWHWNEFINNGLIYLLYRNFAATILVMTLPAIFFLARHSKFLLLLTIPYTMAMILCGSRSALLFGMIMIAECCIYTVRYKILPTWLVMLIIMAAIIVTYLFVLDTGLFKKLYSLRFSEGIFNDENRIAMFKRSIEDLLKNPLCGLGLANTSNNDLFVGVSGSMFYYHNFIAQILGSMGLFGAFAYGILFKDQVVFYFKHKSAFTSAIALSLLGILMISTTNPGIFCPFPDTALMVLGICVLEVVSEDEHEVVLDRTFVLDHKQTAIKSI